MREENLSLHSDFLADFESVFKSTLELFAVYNKEKDTYQMVLDFYTVDLENLLWNAIYVIAKKNRSKELLSCFGNRYKKETRERLMPLLAPFVEQEIETDQLSLKLSDFFELLKFGVGIEFVSSSSIKPKVENAPIPYLYKAIFNQDALDFRAFGDLEIGEIEDPSGLYHILSLDFDYKNKKARKALMKELLFEDEGDALSEISRIEAESLLTELGHYDAPTNGRKLFKTKRKAAAQITQVFLSNWPVGSYFYSNVQDAYTPFENAGASILYSDYGMIGGSQSIWLVALHEKQIACIVLYFDFWSE